MKLLSTSLVYLSLLFMVACVSTDTFKTAQYINQQNAELTRLLTLPEKYSGPLKPMLTSLANDAFDKGLSVENNNPEAAIALYRIAAIAYWRDDNPATVSKLFEVSEHSNKTCQSLADNKPDRDCFLAGFIPILAAVEKAFNVAELDFHQVPDQSNVTEFNALPMKYHMAVETLNAMDSNIGAVKGILPRYIEQIELNKTMLLNNNSMRDYVCDNLYSTYLSLNTRINDVAAHLVTFRAMGADAPNIRQALLNLPIKTFVRNDPAVNTPLESKVKHYMQSKLVSALGDDACDNANDIRDRT